MRRTKVPACNLHQEQSFTVCAQASWLQSVLFTCPLCGLMKGQKQCLGTADTAGTNAAFCHVWSPSDLPQNYLEGWKYANSWPHVTPNDLESLDLHQAPSL